MWMIPGIALSAILTAAIVAVLRWADSGKK